MKPLKFALLTTLALLLLSPISALALNEQTASPSDDAISAYVSALSYDEILQVAEKTDFVAPMTLEDGTVYPLSVYAFNTTNLSRSNPASAEESITYVVSTEEFMQDPEYTDSKSDPTGSATLYMTIYFSRSNSVPGYPNQPGILLTRVSGNASLDPGVAYTTNTLAYGCSNPYIAPGQSRQAFTLPLSSFNYSTGYSTYVPANTSSMVGAGWTMKVNVRGQTYTIPLQVYVYP